jgi:putative hydrolase of the HAD superfamily
VIRALLLDLDDTLFDQQEWLRGAWSAVAASGRRYGVDPVALEQALLAVAAEGSDRGKIIDRALARVTAQQLPVQELVEAFRSWRPHELPLWPGVERALRDLRARVATAVVTDGDPLIQRSKLSALGLEGAFDVEVFSDDAGRAFRKPHPAPFQQALAALGVAAQEAVHVGDRPDKDVAGAGAAGLRAVRVRTGEYRDRPDDPSPWASAPDLVSAVALLSPHLPTSR